MTMIDDGSESHWLSLSLDISPMTQGTAWCTSLSLSLCSPLPNEWLLIHVITLMFLCISVMANGSVYCLCLCILVLAQWKLCSRNNILACAEQVSTFGVLTGLQEEVLPRHGRSIQKFFWFWHGSVEYAADSGGWHAGYCGLEQRKVSTTTRGLV